MVLPVETLSSMISLLIKPKVLLQIKNELDQKTGNVSIDLEYWSIPGKYHSFTPLNKKVGRRYAYKSLKSFQFQTSGCIFRMPRVDAVSWPGRC